ncbi:MAG TPA: hypothetical protein PKI63_03765 [Candidatus Cloacimonadota bacterium]|nr:hypothetical protein [Candidatus Cloacimonadota bacterium]HOH78723.1 hypothetical protein [Candidatus Cloacimonadota bacterium]
MYQPDMVPADPQYRRQVLILLLIIALGLGFLLYSLQPYLQANIDTGTPEQTLQLLKWMLIALGIVPLGFAIYMLVIAIKVYRQGIFPPEGTKVLRDTPILFDQDARRRANILVVLAALLMFMSDLLILMAFYLPKLLTRL